MDPAKDLWCSRKKSRQELSVETSWVISGNQVWWALARGLPGGEERETACLPRESWAGLEPGFTYPSHLRMVADGLTPSCPPLCFPYCLRRQWCKETKTVLDTKYLISSLPLSTSFLLSFIEVSSKDLGVILTSIQICSYMPIGTHISIYTQRNT